MACLHNIFHIFHLYDLNVIEHYLRMIGITFRFVFPIQLYGRFRLNLAAMNVILFSSEEVIPVAIDHSNQWTHFDGVILIWRLAITSCIFLFCVPRSFAIFSDFIDDHHGHLCLTAFWLSHCYMPLPSINVDMYVYMLFGIFVTKACYPRVLFSISSLPNPASYHPTCGRTITTPSLSLPNTWYR